MNELESLFSNAVVPSASAGDKGGGSRSTSAQKQEKIHLVCTYYCLSFDLSVWETYINFLRKCESQLEECEHP